MFGIDRKLLIIAVSLIAAACGGGNGDTPPDDDVPSPLAGTWTGIVTQDADTTSSIIELKFDSTGRLTSVKENEVPQLAIGSGTHEAGEVYRLEMNLEGEALSGRLLRTAGGKHLGLIVDTNAAYGILQKDLRLFQFIEGAFSEAHVTGDWNGYTLTLASNLAIADIYPLQMSTVPNVDIDIIADFSGDDKHGAFSGDITNVWDDIGFYRGAYASTSINGGVIVMISPDKQAAFSIACPAAAISSYVISEVAACTYSLSTK